MGRGGVPVVLDPTRLSRWSVAALGLLFWVAMPAAGHSHGGETDPAFATETGRDCFDMPRAYGRTLCLEGYFRRLARDESPRHAIADAEALKRRGLLDDCHLIAHFVGEEALRQTGDVGTALGACSLGCSQGCLHGVVEAYALAHDDDAGLADDLRHVCDGVSESAFVRWQCIHGVGHGFLAVAYGSIVESVAACNTFDKLDASTCLDGVFMANMQRYLLIPEAELRAELPTICAEADDMGDAGYIGLCSFNIGEGLMFHSGHDLHRSARLCDLLPARQRGGCKRGVLAQYRVTGEPYIEMGPKSWIGVAGANLMVLAGLAWLARRRPRWIGVGLTAAGFGLLNVVFLWDLWR